MPKKKAAKKPAKKAKRGKVAKKAARKVKRVARRPAAQKKAVGTIRHFFPHISVAVVDLTGTLRLGDSILVEGHTTSFSQKADSMQIEHKPIAVAGRGQSIGLKVREKPREGDTVYVVG